MSKRKKGENEAVIILESIGIKIEKNYLDDNSRASMPDLKCENGRYIEVTHTKHNNFLFTGISKYDQLRPGENGDEWIQRHLDKELECSDAIDRTGKMDYDCDEDGNLTDKAKEQYLKDCKLLKSHMGFDPTEVNSQKQFSEFKCDRPIISFSVDNILYEIKNDKGGKQYGVDTDLFIFATEQEYDTMNKLIGESDWNGAAQEFLNEIINSKFSVIYVCSWDIENQEYNISNPQVVRFKKVDKGLKLKCYNKNK